MANHLLTGSYGELLAKEYLINEGFTILHQNWRHSHWEVDFIASRKEILHFIEVKTRRSKTFGNPEDDVTKKKLDNLIQASEVFQFLHPEWKRIQFDILSINLSKNKPPEFFFIEDVYIN